MKFKEALVLGSLALGAISPKYAMAQSKPHHKKDVPNTTLTVKDGLREVNYNSSGYDEVKIKINFPPENNAYFNGFFIPNYVQGKGPLRSYQNLPNSEGAKVKIEEKRNTNYRKPIYHKKKKSGTLERLVNVVNETRISTIRNSERIGEMSKKVDENSYLIEDLSSRVSELYLNSILDKGINYTESNLKEGKKNLPLNERSPEKKSPGKFRINGSVQEYFPKGQGASLGANYVNKEGLVLGLEGEVNNLSSSDMYSKNVLQKDLINQASNTYAVTKGTIEETVNTSVDGEAKLIFGKLMDQTEVDAEVGIAFGNKTKKTVYSGDNEIKQGDYIVGKKPFCITQNESKPKVMPLVGMKVKEHLGFLGKWANNFYLGLGASKVFGIRGVNGEVTGGLDIPLNGNQK